MLLFNDETEYKTDKFLSAALAEKKKCVSISSDFENIKSFFSRSNYETRFYFSYNNKSVLQYLHKIYKSQFFYYSYSRIIRCLVNDAINMI